MKNFFSVLAPIVIVLQETWFLPTDPYNFNLFNYCLYRHDELYGERRHGGVALYINNNFTHSEIQLQTDLQAVACTVFLNGRNIDICSIYIPPNSDTQELLNKLNALVVQFTNPFLLLGDFNAHSPSWWEGQRLDVRGKKIEEFVARNNLVTLNENRPTHFNISHNTESAIDLSLCSPLLGTWFDWSADGDIHDSDHYPIFLKTTFDYAGTPFFFPRWKLDKAEWQQFTDICDEMQLEQQDNPEEGIQHITNFIISAAKRTIPITKPCSRANAVPWWSAEVRQAIAKRKRAFRTYLRLRTQQALIARNRERGNARRVIRSAKQASWQLFLSRFSSATPISQMWSLVRRLTGKRAIPNIPIIRIPGNPIPISEPREVVNVIAGRIAQNSSDINYSAEFISLIQNNFNIPKESFSSENELEYNDVFSLMELKSAIASSGNTSVGPDELHYAFFRHLSDNCLQKILHTFNDLWQKHVFPEDWKECIIIAIPKPGKHRSNPDNYRPIALTSCLGKLLERMVANRLSFTIEKHQMISKYQCGFRKNHSTMDHLIRLETDIRKGFKNRKHTTAVFLDVTKAYDMVHKGALIKKLHKIGLRGNMAHYLYNFLSGDRVMRVRYRSIFSDFQELKNGLPQGSCLSPILFNIFIDDLFHDTSLGIPHSLFADDSAIWCTDDDYDISITRLQACLVKLEKWSNENGLQFSAGKSAAVVFSRWNNVRPARNLRIFNNTIPFVKHFKFLGVVLDSRLSMVKHVEHIKKKCSIRMNLFRCLTSRQCGADRITLLRLYKAIVRPIIEYGAVVYAGGKKLPLASIETIQNSFLRIAIGAMKTSPVAALQVETNVPPLYVRRMEITLRYVTKIKQHPEHASRKAIDTLPRIHHSYIGPSERRTGLTIASRMNMYRDELQIDLPNITPLSTLDEAPWRLHPRSVSFLFECNKTSVPLSEIHRTFNAFQAEHNTFQFIYTDGSKSNERTGNAIIAEGLTTLKGRLPNNTSIYMAELHAIFIALRLIERYNI